MYIGLDNSVKDVMTALRSVGDLQNSAIRDRHWEEVRIVTGVSQNSLFCFFEEKTIY